MITPDFRDYMKEMYAVEISATKISHIIDKIIPAMNEWRNRPLGPSIPLYSQILYAIKFVKVEGLISGQFIIYWILTLKVGKT